MPVEFNEDYQGGSYQNQRFNGYNNSASQPKMVAWLIKKHIAKTEKSANNILLCMALIFFILSIVIFLKFVT